MFSYNNFIAPNKQHEDEGFVQSRETSTIDQLLIRAKKFFSSFDS